MSPVESAKPVGTKMKNLIKVEPGLFPEPIFNNFSDPLGSSLGFFKSRVMSKFRRSFNGSSQFLEGGSPDEADGGKVDYEKS